MRHVSCNLCGRADAARRLWMLPDRHWAPEDRFTLVQCCLCGFVYLNPQLEPHELGRHYPSWAYVRQPVDAPTSFVWRAQHIERHRSVGKLLDVGCGTGGFMTFLQQRGWDVHGFDNADGAVTIARELVGDRAKVATLAEAGYPSEQFDVVCLFEVLEHLPDPVGHLKAIHRILVPGGFVCLSVPNFSSWERWLFGRWWNGLDLPRHFQQFTLDTLRRCLTIAGLEVVELRSVNACCIQVDRSRISYCQESLRFFLRDLGWYPKRSAMAPSPHGTAPSSAPATIGKRVVRTMEGLVFGAFCQLARLADRDNSLWACARKP